MADVKSENTYVNSLSCQGRAFNVSHEEVVNSVYVGDEFVVSYALKWIKNNVERYKFVGREASNIKKAVCTMSGDNMNAETSKKTLDSFFKLLINNPFYAENGIGITESTYILGKSLDSYFVVYKGNIIVPIASLKQIVHGKIDIVLEEFVEEAKKYTIDAINVSSSKINAVKNRIDEMIVVSPATMFRAISGALLAILSLTYVILCALKIDWKNINLYVEKTETLRQLIGFAGEEGFGINHNSYLIFLLYAIALFWLLYYLLFIRLKFIKEFKHALNYRKFRNVKKSMNVIGEKFPLTKENITEARNFIDENKDSLGSIFLNPSSKAKEFGPQMVAVANAKNGEALRPFGRVLPKSVKVLCLLVIATLVLTGFAKTDAFKQKFDATIADYYVKTSNADLNSKVYHIAKDLCNIYTLPDVSSLVVCQLQPSSKCQLVETEQEEDFCKVLFEGQFGRLSGWIEKENITEYNPTYDVDVKKAEPLTIEGSSELTGKKYYGVKNVLDGDFWTSWQEGSEGLGLGEWLTIKYDEPKEIVSIGMLNGNGSSEELYLANVRPSCVTFIFYLNGEYVDELSHNYADIFNSIQYFEMSRSILADEILVRIDDVNIGSTYEDACISELEIYYKY